ncbi:Citrate synthase (si) [Caballeronia sordidicola]|uniref:citrate synthase (unknown stereospecificity) n=2 Tax=Caballeronia sordidicola TaxID=196367 RepID=A0A242N3F9_CABSO|nr:Citrate synthase (si) [Caballeronia sordidicola]
MGWITAAEALGILGVRPQTLYANVSRGKIRAQPDKADSRRSLYHREDVLRMAKRSNGRRKVETVAAQAIEWGDPVLPSAISTVIDGRLWYRGLDAVALSGTASLEDVAALLWDCPEAPRLRPATKGDRVIHGRGGSGGALRAGLIALSERSANDLPSIGCALPVLREEAASVLVTLAQAMLGNEESSGDRPLSEHISTLWARRDAEDMIRRALVLLADHELNASTFAARVTISTGASLAAGMLAGLASLTGPLHGRASLALNALIASTERLGVEQAVREWLAQGRTLPGFGHPLYPDGDVRAAALLELLPTRRAYTELLGYVARSVGEAPNIDFALAVIAETFDLPAEAPFILFALGRCVGWLAHALEQVEAHRLIRPRARYVGVVSDVE